MATYIYILFMDAATPPQGRKILSCVTRRSVGCSELNIAVRARTDAISSSSNSLTPWRNRSLAAYCSWGIPSVAGSARVLAGEQFSISYVEFEFSKKLKRAFWF